MAHVYSNQEISELLTNIATAYEIKKKNRFRTVAYQNAADTINTYPQNIYEIWQQDPKSLDNVPGIGQGILEKLHHLFSTGHLHPHIKKALKNIHPAVFTFTKVNGIGPKIAHKLTLHLKFPQRNPIKSLEKLITYAQNGKIRHLPTFGEKSESIILENTQNFLGHRAKMTYSQATTATQNIIAYLHQKFPDLIIEPLGSLRRQAPFIGDIDIAAQNSQATPILDYFIQYPQSIHTIVKGPKKASIKTLNDIRVDLMVQPYSTWGSLLQHFTGSKQHNIKLREYAQTLGYSLSEYGIKDLRSQQIHTFKDENSFYHFLGLNYIPPQQRLGKDEIDQAKI